MKLYAKVKFKRERDAETLIKAFFKEFNPESGISLIGMDAEVEITFEKPPVEIIKALSCCQVLKFKYGKIEYCFGQKTAECEETGQNNLENAESKHAEQKEEDDRGVETKSSKAKNKGDKTQKKKNSKSGSSAPTCIPELEELAKKSNSFEHFATLVAEWLNMEKRQEMFVNLVVASTEVKKISWKELEDVLKQKGINFTHWEQIDIGRKISAKLSKYSITVLILMNRMSEYKEYPFHKNIKENSAEAKEEAKTSESILDVEGFKEILENVDKSHTTIVQRFQEVLDAMGLENKAVEEQKLILEITKQFIKNDEVTDIDSLLLLTDIPTEQRKEAQMIFAQFINKYAKTKVKVFSFLTDVKKNIMD